MKNNLEVKFGEALGYTSEALKELSRSLVAANKVTTFDDVSFNSAETAASMSRPTAWQPFQTYQHINRTEIQHQESGYQPLRKSDQAKQMTTISKPSLRRNGHMPGEPENATRPLANKSPYYTQMATEPLDCSNLAPSSFHPVACPINRSKNPHHNYMTSVLYSSANTPLPFDRDEFQRDGWRAYEWAHLLQSAQDSNHRNHPRRDVMPRAQTGATHYGVDYRQCTTKTARTPIVSRALPQTQTVCPCQPVPLCCSGVCCSSAHVIPRQTACCEACCSCSFDDRRATSCANWRCRDLVQGTLQDPRDNFNYQTLHSLMPPNFYCTIGQPSRTLPNQKGLAMRTGVTGPSARNGPPLALNGPPLAQNGLPLARNGPPSACPIPSRAPSQQTSAPVSQCWECSGCTDPECAWRPQTVWCDNRPLSCVDDQSIGSHLVTPNVQPQRLHFNESIPTYSSCSNAQIITGLQECTEAFSRNGIHCSSSSSDDSRTPTEVTMDKYQYPEANEIQVAYDDYEFPENQISTADDSGVISVFKMSPKPERKPIANRNDSRMKYYPTSAFKFYMEQHVENVMKYYKERQDRLRGLEKDMEKLDLTEDERNQLRLFLSWKESRHLRLRRTKMNKNMFEKLAVLGSGAFGNVYLVRKKDSRVLYAMKTLQKRDVLKKKQIAHVKAERDILAEADNEWVVRLYYSFQDATHLYFVMDYIQGGDLMGLLMKLEIFGHTLTQFYIAELVLAIDSVHKLGFIHRDIKPDNILIDLSGHIKLTDFGLCTGFHWTHDSSYYKHGRQREDQNGERCEDEAQPVAADHRRLVAKSLVGTPNYIAPEVLLETGYTSCCDWWSVGVILYEMRVGQAPFLARTALETQLKVINWPTTLVIPDSANLSQETIDLILCLCSDPRDRLGRQGAGEVKGHPFFSGINFETLRQQPAPYLPRIVHPTDTSNFDSVDPLRLKEDTSVESVVQDSFLEDAFLDFTFRRFFDDESQVDQREEVDQRVDQRQEVDQRVDQRQGVNQRVDQRQEVDQGQEVAQREEVEYDDGDASFHI